MNKDMIYGALRNLGVMCLGWLVGKGYVTGDQASILSSAVEQAGPVLVALGITAYGMYKKRDAAKAVQADKLPGVTVTVDEKTASPAVVDAARGDNGIRLIKDTSP